MKMKSKFKIAVPIIISAIIILGLTLPTSAHASIASLLGLNDIATDFVIAVGSAIAWVLNWLLKASAAFFEGMLGIGFTHTLDTIKEGWTACRDFANMLFILFMVVIAFGTILRIEEYGIKKLLPKVIGIALLINFSMVFCSIFIDFSNLTAEFFIKDIKGKISGTNGTNGAISATFADAFNMAGTQISYTDCDAYLIDATKACKNIRTDLQSSCLEQAQKNKESCDKAGQIQVAGEKKDFLNVFLGYTVGSIIIALASFSLFAGGIMLLFRIIAIWFLVIITPLVFMCYILPSLKSNWQKWWKTFLNWCIFAPAYSFFVWMAVKIAVSGANKRMGTEASSYAPIGNFGSINNQFVSNPGEQLIGYFVIIFFLIGGLIVAKSLGIYGADAFMKIAKGAQKGAANWVKSATSWAGKKAINTGKEWGTKGLGTIKQGFGATLKDAPLFGSAGRRMEASGKLLKQKSAENKESEIYKKRLALMSKEDVMKEIKMKHLRDSFKLSAIQEYNKRGKFATNTDEKDQNAIRKSIEILRGYGFEKEAKDIKDARPDLILDEKEREEKLKDLRRDKELSKLSAATLKDSGIVKLLTKICEAEELEALRVNPRYKDNFKETLINIKNTTPADELSIKFKEAFAQQIGDWSLLNETEIASLAKRADAETIKRLGGKDIKNSENILQKIAENLSEGNIGELINKIQGENKTEVSNIMAAHLNKVKSGLVENNFVLKSIVEKNKKPTSSTDSNQSQQSQKSQKTTEDIKYIRTAQETSFDEQKKRAEDAARRREGLK